jgi:hypothetical protein
MVKSVALFYSKTGIQMRFTGSAFVPPALSPKGDEKGLIAFNPEFY